MNYLGVASGRIWQLHDVRQGLCLDSILELNEFIGISSMLMHPGVNDKNKNTWTQMNEIQQLT